MMQQYDKMILAILQGDDYHDAVHSLNEHGFYATVLNSSGGFLKKRSVTLMIGLESARLDEALAILKKHGERTEMRYEAPVLSPNMPPIPLSTAPLEIPTRCGGVDGVFDQLLCGAGRALHDLASGDQVGDMGRKLLDLWHNYLTGTLASASAEGSRAQIGN